MSIRSMTIACPAAIVAAMIAGGAARAEPDASSPAPQVTDIGAATPEMLAPGLNRRFVAGSETTMAIFDFKAGAVVPEHHHVNEQVSYIPSGKVRVTAAGKTFIVGTGQVIIIPPNMPHSFEALEDTVDIDFFAPARADWLSGTASYFNRPTK